MSDALLNLKGLRKAVYPRGTFPSSPFERLFRSGQPIQLSRRGLFQLASVAASTAAVPMKPDFTLELQDDVLQFKINGMNRWVIDPSKFSGSPRLETVLGTDRTSFRLHDAFFPGTTLPADLTGVAWSEAGRWLLHLVFSLGGFETNVPLIEWLTNEEPATSIVRLPRTLLALGSDHGLRFSGNATAAFSPNWSFLIEGRSVASLRGFGESLRSDSVQLSLAGRHDQSLFEQPPNRRSVIALHGAERNWKIPLDLNSQTPWSLDTPEGAFDLVQVEFADSTNGTPYAALVARNVDEARSVSFCAGDRLRSLDGSPLSFQLERPRYAMAFHDGTRRSAFMADFSRLPIWGRSGNLVLQFGPSMGVPFELTTHNGELHALHAAPSLLQVSAPLGDQGVSAGPIPICGTPPITLDFTKLPGFFHRLKCWLGLCEASTEFCVPMHGSKLSILRHTDLLRLDLEFRHLGLHYHHGHPFLTRLDANGHPTSEDADPATLPEALIIVHFPPQNIYEEAFDEGSGMPPRIPPVQARISGPSRVVLRFNRHRIRYTLESLLNFARFEMKLVSTAVPPGERPSDPNSKPVKPTDEETSLELPYRLYLSPNRFAGWANRRVLPDLSRENWIEMWHARLGILHRDGIDERESARRTLRAVWSEEYTDDPCLPPQESKYIDVPFLGTLSPRDRVELVELTSNFCLKDPTDPEPNPLKRRPYRPEPVSAELVMLSAMGAWLKSTGQWTPPLTNRGQALTVELWKHVATMGRDHYVRVEYKGYLMPYGYPCTLVKVTERKFVPLPGIQGYIAFLRQRCFILIKREEKTYYPSGALGQPNGARRWPYRRVMFEKNYTTPPLDTVCPRDEFWPQTLEPGSKTPQDFIFRYKVEDLDGTIFDCASPLKFVDATVAYSECTSDDLNLVDGKKCDNFDGSRVQVIPGAPTRLQNAVDDYNNAKEERRLVRFLGRKVAYAPSRKPGDTQFETDFIRLAAEKQDSNYKCITLFAADQAPIYPWIERAGVNVASISELTGHQAVTEIEYDDTYVRGGFNDGANRGEVFVKFPNGPVPLTFGGSSQNADKSGAIITPNAGVVGLSRKIGPVCGSSTTSLEVTAKAQFDPSDFFAAALSEARILGGIKLADIIRPFAKGAADALEQAPKVLRRALSAADAVIEKEAKIFYDAAIPIRNTIQAGINPVVVIKARFQSQVDVISQDLDDLAAEIKVAPADDFDRVGHDARLIDLQGKILSAFRTLAAQIDDTLRHPQTLLQAEIDLLLSEAKTFLDQKFSPQLNQLTAFVIGTASNAIDQLTLAVVNAVIDILTGAGAAIAHSQIFKDALNRAQSGLAQAVKDLQAAAPAIENAVVFAAQAIDRFNKVREEIRRVADLAQVTVDDFNVFQSTLRNLGNFPLSDFQSARTNFDRLFKPYDDPANASLRRAYQEILGGLNQIDAISQKTVTDADAFIQAQAELARSIQNLLNIVPGVNGSPLERFLMGWVSQFTCLTTAAAKPLQDIENLLKAAGTAVAEVQRVKLRADTFIAKVDAARKALGDPTLPQNLPQVIELLVRFGQATGCLEEAVDILPLSADAKQKLRDAATQLDAYVGQVKGTITQVQAIYKAMGDLADAAPLILKAVILQEIDELSAPLKDYAMAVEQRAIDIIVQVLANSARFVSDLLKRLESPASQLANLLNLARDVEQVLADLLAPRAIELSYTFSPALTNSPFDVFEVVENGGKNLLVTVRSVTYIAFNPAQAKPPEFSIRGLLQSFNINLLASRSSSKGLNFITIEFESLEFTSGTGSPPHCNVKIKNVLFGEALTFVKNLQDLLNPSQGPYLLITPLQVIAGFRFAVPSFTTGGFSLRNLRFDASLTLPFTGDPARFRFKISDRDNPFILSVGIFGGGGWFSLVLGVDGVDETELALEFGLAGDINIGIATGYGRVMGGIYIHYKRGVGTELAGFIDISGHVDVLGLISLTLSVYYGLRRLPTGQCFGEADITVKIEMFFFDIEVHLHTQKQFAGDSGGATNAMLDVAPNATLDDGRSGARVDEDAENREIDWEQYISAFAAV